MRGADGWAKNQLGERRLGELFLGLGLGLAFWRIGFRRIGTEPLKMPFRDNRYSLITIICCEAVQYTILATAWLLV